MAKLGVYGKRIIGEEQAAAEKAAVAVRADKYGPRITDPNYVGKAAKKNVAPVVTQPPADVPPHEHVPQLVVTIEEINGVETEVTRAVCECGEETADPSFKPVGNSQVAGDAATSIKELEVALAENPATVDTFLAAEINRAEGARIGALRALRETEGQHQNRADVLDLIDMAIAEKQAK